MLIYALIRLNQWFTKTYHYWCFDVPLRHQYTDQAGLRPEPRRPLYLQTLQSVNEYREKHIVCNRNLSSYV